MLFCIKLRRVMSIFTFTLISGFLVCLSEICAVRAVNPGLRLRISQNGLNYASQVAVDILSQKIRKLPLPYIKGKTKEHHFKIEYELSNMAITSFGKPKTSVIVVPGHEITWTVTGASISISGQWRLKWRYHFIHKTDHGSFDVSASGIDFKLSVTMGIDKNRRPTISSPSCSSNVAHVKAKFHGSHLSWLYNLFDHQVAKMIQKQLQTMICKNAQEAINVNAAKQLAKMKIMSRVGKTMELDYGLIAPPLFGAKYVETSHKGEVYWLAQHTEAPFQAPPLPPDTDASKMMYVWMSDYIFNTLGHVASTHGTLKYYLTAKELPPDKRSYLNTTCKFICIGSLIHALQKFPDASVEIGMQTTSDPKFMITESSVNGFLTGTLQFNARKKDASLTPLFTTDAKANLSFSLAVKNGNITGSLKTLTYTFHVTKSAIGKIDDKALTSVLQFISDNYLKKAINDIAGVGIPIPNLDDVKLINTDIKLEKDAIRISTDVQYRPHMINSVLYFHPMLL